MGQIQNLEDLLNFLARRWRLIALIALIGVLASAFYAKSLPDTYEAAALIQVQGAQVGGDGTAPGGSAQLMQSIEQRLTTRDAMAAMIERHGLYADLPALTMDQKILLLRQSVTFQGVEAAGNAAYGTPTQISAIIILARDGDPDKAARIANDFAQGILDMSSSGQLERARDTYAFYLEEESRISSQIAALEADVAAYRNENADALPTVADARRDELVGLETDLRELDQTLVAVMEEQRQLAEKGDLRATERRRLQELDGQIAVLAEQKAALEARKAELQTSIAALPEIERGLAAMERELAQLQASLDVVSAKLVEAETDQRLAERQQGERFALLDRAITPEMPLGSGGKRIFAAGTIASLLLGVALAFILDLMKPVVRTSAQMERQLGLRPIVAIPDLGLPGRKARQGSGGGSGPRLADLRDKALALPRVVLVSSGMTLVLMTAAAFS